MVCKQCRACLNSTRGGHTKYEEGFALIWKCRGVTELSNSVCQEWYQNTVVSGLLKLSYGTKTDFKLNAVFHKVVWSLSVSTHYVDSKWQAPLKRLSTPTPEAADLTLPGHHKTKLAHWWQRFDKGGMRNRLRHNRPRHCLGWSLGNGNVGALVTTYCIDLLILLLYFEIGIYDYISGFFFKC